MTKKPEIAKEDDLRTKLIEEGELSHEEFTVRLDVVYKYGSMY